MIDETYPVDISPPDISAYRAGNTGIEYATTLDSGKSGPHVMVTAVVHGNELCGAVTLDWLMKENVRPVGGKLTLMFCNIAAYLSFDPTTPQASRFVDEDFNRVWAEATLDGPRKSRELARAREIRPLVGQADLLLDIHSMQHPTLPLMLSGPLEKGRRFARDVGVPATIVSDEGHSAGKRMRDYGAFGEPASPKNALLVECGQHWEAKSNDVAKETALRFLLATGAVPRDWVEARLPAARPLPQRTIEVTHAITIGSEAFRFVSDFRGLEEIPKAGDEIARDGDTVVRAPYDNCVLIMPSRRLGKGQTAVRLGRYVP
ncbi:MAG: succinylglutamate desuccinylase/aspartoacylase family protein [Proteobacteria bacterium]|nr:succinylglutamate desuccinylase/aspartoacylase family protein [Pseudomonadota bacterium]